MFDPDKPFQTKDGRKARLLGKSNSSGYCLAVAIEEDGEEFIETYTHDGFYLAPEDRDEEDDSYDLVNIPERFEFKEQLYVFTNGLKYWASEYLEQGGFKPLAKVTVTVSGEAGEGL